MLPPEHPDGIHIAFDDHRLVNNAGLILPATLALHLDLGRAWGPANTGDKIVTLEVWPESHWPGFALRQADVLQSYTA